MHMLAYHAFNRLILAFSHFDFFSVSGGDGLIKMMGNIGGGGKRRGDSKGPQGLAGGRIPLGAGMERPQVQVLPDAKKGAGGGGGGGKKKGKSTGCG